ncbi:hypothetical protein CAPTEDRAFT_203932 [Capitella teleta]|uniref:BTB domain-containing protein n=1 Tax=Capitella teleta TaxID=283909 RepID=R7V647_CAPTE|nr:hypothetical protein CAPTEDRAFT_203932 [Capitella teleta]|eukprot:ELU14338.1 hypothetical protein CAPTEDRAFT_203932 [Capitella teleta]
MYYKCDYFHRMFLTGLLESGRQEVIMQEISAATGLLLVDYLYTGQIEITTLNAQDLLAASDMLLLGDLKQKVEDFLCSHTEPKNYAKKYFHEHLIDIFDEEEIHLLQEEDLFEVLDTNTSQEDNFCLT